MYVCGPTVQSSPHIGHLRSALAYDLWRRWLSARGYAVTFVRNVTDIDDKILANAPADGAEPWWALAYRVELEFTAGYSTIGILPPTYEPRATASVPQMQELIERLIERGHAYVADDGSGDVYFDVKTWPAYGELTNQKLDDMADSPDAETARQARPARLRAVEGRQARRAGVRVVGIAVGRRAARAGTSSARRCRKRYLGPAFDIHGGGLDLRFPHHENELAQSTADGDAFASYWVHNGLVNVEGQKMSKSLGNSVFASELLALARPVVVRYYLASAHYRSNMDYSRRRADRSRDGVRAHRGLPRSGVADPRGHALRERRGTRHPRGIRRRHGRRPGRAAGARRAARQRAGRQRRARRRRPRDRGARCAKRCSP